MDFVLFFYNSFSQSTHLLSYKRVPIDLVVISFLIRDRFVFYDIFGAH